MSFSTKTVLAHQGQTDVKKRVKKKLRLFFFFFWLHWDVELVRAVAMDAQAGKSSH